MYKKKKKIVWPYFHVMIKSLDTVATLHTVVGE